MTECKFGACCLLETLISATLPPQYCYCECVVGARGRRQTRQQYVSAASRANGREVRNQQQDRSRGGGELVPHGAGNAT